jgi:hypothetical protein
MPSWNSTVYGEGQVLNVFEASDENDNNLIHIFA